MGNTELGVGGVVRTSSGGHRRTPSQDGQCQREGGGRHERVLVGHGYLVLRTHTVMVSKVLVVY